MIGVGRGSGFLVPCPPNDHRHRRSSITSSAGTATPAVGDRQQWASSTVGSACNFSGVRYVFPSLAMVAKRGSSIARAVIQRRKVIIGTLSAAATVSTSFAIGRQLIAIADNRTHLTKVYINGKLVRTMKSSLGKGGSTTGANGEHISYWTAGGPHVVLPKERVHSMSSASYGITDPDDPNYYGAEDIEY
jgi:hypothetical protein